MPLWNELKITGFRCFHDYTIRGLKRVNLLVGGNNSGKTTVLEAASILGSGGDAEDFLYGLSRRGEYTAPIRPDDDAHFNITHCFYGHRYEVGSKIAIAACGEGQSDSIVQYTVVSSEGEKNLLFDDLDFPDSEVELYVKISYGNGEEQAGEENGFLIGPNGALLIGNRRRAKDGRMLYRSIPWPRERPSSKPVYFLGTEGSDVEQLVFFWDHTQLKPEQQRIVDALKFVEESIEAIAWRSSYPPPRISPFRGTRSRRGGFIIGLKDTHEPVPLGVLGDGVFRLLGLALHLAGTKNGILLVDEIDTGLHYSVMCKMWRMVLKTARKDDIQIFSTTHSLDCIRALGKVLEEEENYHDEVALHRIDAAKEEAFTYDAEMIQIAVDDMLEVR